MSHLVEGRHPDAKVCPVCGKNVAPRGLLFFGKSKNAETVLSQHKFNGRWCKGGGYTNHVGKL